MINIFSCVICLPSDRCFRCKLNIMLTKQILAAGLVPVKYSLCFLAKTNVLPKNSRKINGKSYFGPTETGLFCRTETSLRLGV